MMTMPRRSLTEARHPRPREIRHVGLLVFVVGALLSGIFAPPSTEAAGPWQAQVVDAETGEPLEGVVIVARWERVVYGHPPIGFGLGRGRLYGSEEIVTGADGRFVLPPRLFFNPTLGVEIEGPDLILFKAGYGGWRLRDSERRVPEALKALGAVIEMRPLKTPVERRKYQEYGWNDQERHELRRWAQGLHPANPGDVAWERVQRYEGAINAERAELGLGPIGVGFPSLDSRPEPERPPEGYRVRTRRGSGSPPTPLALPPSVTLLGSWGWVGGTASQEGAVPPRAPSGIMVDPAGNLWVADTGNHRVVKLSPTLMVLGEWGTLGRRDGEFQRPLAVAVDRRGAVYVADSGNERIQKFSPEGEFLGKWGRLRYEEYEGSRFSPTALAVTRSGEVLVFLDFQSQVHRFSRSGRRRGDWRVRGGFWGFTPFAADAEGHVYAINEERDLRKFDREGTPLGSWPLRNEAGRPLTSPAALATDAAGRVYVADQWAGGARIHVYDARGTLLVSWGSYGQGRGQFRGPSGIAVDQEGHVYVADRSNYRVQKFAVRLEPEAAEVAAQP